MATREPAVAGAFYEGSPERLRAQVAACFSANPTSAARERIIAAVVPHAGLMYSGHVAAAVYEAAELPQRLIILCPNHTGLGADVAINLRGSWRTPLGEVAIDEELATELAAASAVFEDDRTAHAREHSLEVQLPFLQTVAPRSKFVPICIRRPRYELCAEVGEAVAMVAAAHPGEVAILSSSDLNHYENQEVTLQKDQKAIDAILSLDARKLWNVVRDEDISMCGILPTTATLIAADRLGAQSARLLKHATSGDINGDYSGVVGYAGIVIQ